MIFTFDEFDGIHHVTYRMPERRKVLIGWSPDRKLAFKYCLDLIGQDLPTDRWVYADLGTAFHEGFEMGIFDEAADD